MLPDLNWLTDPTVFQVNRLSPHSDHVCFATDAEARLGDSSLRQSLDGLWRFAWSPRPADRPADFWKPDFDDAAFETIQVPGHMELQGYGQIQYINCLYPWDGHAELRPPEIDWDHCAVGSYVRQFDLDPGLRGKRRVRISFQGVEQALFVWLNGHFVGYSEDSFTPSEFDLTPYMQDTGNRLCAEVFQRCSGGWLEDQDFFRFSGIFRSVYLSAEPAAHLEDVWFQPWLDADCRTGSLRLRLKLCGEDPHVHCVLSHPDMGVIFALPLELAEEEDGYLWSQTFPLEHLRPWSHETPELYHVTLTVSDRPGAVTEVIPYDIGFRRFELRDGLLRLNGERLVLRGVNRHEWSPETGRAIGPEDMAQAVETLLKNRCNAVRTCHYPNQTLWYHLCDRHGLYVMDEANLESHGSWQKLNRTDPSWNVPGSDPAWQEATLDRARSMFERDKNHPSILFWSCGNESYAGENLLAMAEYFRSQDSSRLVHYEGVFHCRAFDRISDVESRMYATPEDIRAYLEGKPEKPFLLCEYLHGMGNSMGGMERYIQLEEEFPQYQGGFLWDYMDQALRRRDCLGRRVLGYGGDFNDRQSDYAFSANGLLFADGTEKPAMQEVRYWYAPRPERTAWDQANLLASAATPLPAPPHRTAPLHISCGDGALGVRGEGFEVLFSYPEGGPVSLRAGGREWLWRAPRPAYWRAPTDNDRGNGFARSSSIWSAADSWQVCEGFQILDKSEAHVSIRYTYTAPALPGLRTEVVYALDRTGILEVQVHYHGAAGRPELPLLGLRFATPVPLDTVRWLGLSGETYPDRKRGGLFGWHREVPHIPGYIVPQECGCHTDTRAAVLTQGRGSLILAMEQLLSFSAIPYTPQQLEQAAHIEELPPPVRTVVTVCGGMRGVGGIDSWGADVGPEAHVSGETDQSFSFRIYL